MWGLHPVRKHIPIAVNQLCIMITHIINFSAISWKTFCIAWTQSPNYQTLDGKNFWDNCSSLSLWLKNHSLQSHSILMYQKCKLIVCLFIALFILISLILQGTNRNPHNWWHCNGTSNLSTTPIWIWIWSNEVNSVTCSKKQSLSKRTPSPQRLYMRG